MHRSFDRSTLSTKTNLDIWDFFSLVSTSGFIPPQFQNHFSGLLLFSSFSLSLLLRTQHLAAKLFVSIKEEWDGPSGPTEIWAVVRTEWAYPKVRGDYSSISPLYIREPHTKSRKKEFEFLSQCLPLFFPLGWTNSLPGHLSGDQTRKPDGDSFFRCSFLFHGMPRDVDVATRWNVPHSSLSTLIETLEWWFDCLPIIPRWQTWSGNVCSGDKIVFVWAGDNIPNIYPSPVSRFPGRLEILSPPFSTFLSPFSAASESDSGTLIDREFLGIGL